MTLRRGVAFLELGDIYGVNDVSVISALRYYYFLCISYYFMGKNEYFFSC